MKRAITTLTAAIVAVGLAAGAPTSAQAFIIAPAVAAAVLAGGVFTGAVVGTAASNANRPVVAVAPGPGVTVGSTTCYFTHAWVGHVWRRVQICNNY